MKTDVVEGRPADTSEMFGAATSAGDIVQAKRRGFACPFLVFCAAFTPTE
jgi:hypothetical protein